MRRKIWKKRATEGKKKEGGEASRTRGRASKVERTGGSRRDCWLCKPVGGCAGGKTPIPSVPRNEGRTKCVLPTHSIPYQLCRPNSGILKDKPAGLPDQYMRAEGIPEMRDIRSWSVSFSTERPGAPARTELPSVILRPPGGIWQGNGRDVHRRFSSTTLRRGEDVGPKIGWDSKGPPPNSPFLRGPIGLIRTAFLDCYVLLFDFFLLVPRKRTGTSGESVRSAMPIRSKPSEAVDVDRARTASGLRVEWAGRGRGGSRRCDDGCAPKEQRGGDGIGGCSGHRTAIVEHSPGPAYASRSAT